MHFSNPIFPDFKPLKLENKEEIENFTIKFKPYSDFNFVSLWSYDIHDDVIFSWLNENFVMRFRDYLSKEHFYTFLGNTKPTETIETLLKFSKEQGLPESLSLIPETNIKELINQDNNFIFRESEDHHDYIISLKKTIELSNINPHKLASYHKFLTDNPNYELRELDINNLQIQKEMTDLFRLWTQERSRNWEDVRYEFDAHQKLFKYSSHFKLVTLGIYINNKLVCYLIDERTQKPYVIGHFMKADLNYKGIYEVMNKLSAEIHHKEGYEFINIEQDLGIEGLRISKKQRNPVEYLKKYIITKRI